MEEKINPGKINEAGIRVAGNDFCFSESSISPNLLLALSLRKDRNMKVFYESGKDLEALINRKKFFKGIGISSKKVVSIKSVHGDKIAIVNEKDCGKFIEDTDGLITACRDVYLSITVADCLPVIIFSQEKAVVSLLHCGWKGLKKDLISKAVLKMKDNFNIDPKELYAGIGPGIGKCHYEVGEDLKAGFRTYPEAFLQRHGKIYADLKLIAQKQLEYSGIDRDNIDVSQICTYCQAEKYFSRRKDKSEQVEAMIAIAGII